MGETQNEEHSVTGGGSGRRGDLCPGLAPAQPGGAGRPALLGQR